MKKLLVFVGLIFICITALAHSVEWYVDGSLYQTTTCDAGDNITPPTAPEKYGYHFVEWGGYTQLEYIESTGTQYIITPLTASDGPFDFECDFMPTSFDYGGKYGAIFGIDINYQAGIFDNGVAYIGNATSPYNVRFELYKKSNVSGAVSTDASQTYFYVDGEDTGLQRASTSSSGNQLFAASGNYFVKGRMYFFRATRNNSIIFNALPVRRMEDDKVGMYDTVSQTFFTNAGTGEFVAGPVVGGI